MKIVKEYFFLKEGEFSKSEEFSKLLEEIRIAIKSVSSDGETDKFIINPIKDGNGVVPIKTNFVSMLEKKGWEPEKRMSFAQGMRPGPVDVIKTTSKGEFAVEWETGNISSSHRALNKIAVGIIQKAIIGGILIVPIRNLAQYLTQRIGNYEEIEPYFVMYDNLNIKESGIMGVIAIEHDETSTTAKAIPKGKDGNAKK